MFSRPLRGAVEGEPPRSENNLDNNETVIYTYDNGGNILSKTKYPYTVGEVTGEGSVIVYEYGDADWGDLLTKYNGESITYDGIGNPLSYRSGMEFEWSAGRTLTSFSTPNAVGEYAYNADGIRVYKEVNGNTTEYYLNGTQIETEITNYGGVTRRIDYIYDENGSVYGFVVNNTDKYYYAKNLQGDVIGILDASGTTLVEYSYDAWGKAVVSYGDTESLTEAEREARYLLGSNNPFRYRSYYFDVETGFYYLNSRYYDPEIGRFINADGLVSTGQGVLANNMFAYCGNNPVNNVDYSGRFLGKIGSLFNAFGLTVLKTAVKVVEAIVCSFELEIGVGYGLGASGEIGDIGLDATAYHDHTTVGFDDGESYVSMTGKVSVEAQVTDNIKLGVSTEYEHRFETNLVKYRDEHDTTSAPWDVYNCDHTTKEPFQASLIVPPSQNGKGTLFLGADASLHIGVGGHIRVGWDVVEFFEILTR